MAFEPSKKFFGGYSPQDGTVDFYGRVNSIINPGMTVLDLGAGRASWYEDDDCSWRKSLRQLRTKVNKVIAVDVDEAVLDNRAADECLLMKDGFIPLSDSSVDLIIADYVLEHIDIPNTFVAEVNRVLKSGGYFCARTPHKWNYVSIMARLVPNKKHALVLSKAQSKRKEVDVFPTVYRMNLLTKISNLFPSYQNHTFIYRSEPSYYFGSKIVFSIQNFLHRLAPASVVGNLFIFLRKP
jgi:ubiquinone/menaquinone biosynthesis C-methylase UbiE